MQTLNYPLAEYIVKAPFALVDTMKSQKISVAKGRKNPHIMQAKLMTQLCKDTIPLISQNGQELALKVINEIKPTLPEFFRRAESIEKIPNNGDKLLIAVNEMISVASEFVAELIYVSMGSKIDENSEGYKEFWSNEINEELKSKTRHFGKDNLYSLFD